MRKMMKSEGITIPDNAAATLETARKVINPETAIQEIVTLPSVKPKYHDKKQVKTSVPSSEPISFEESKSREITSHLKTVMLVSVLCLVLVGSLYFLELRIHWVEQILLSPYFSGK